VDGSLAGMPMITLRPGVALCGGTLRFGAKGVRLTSDNTLEDVTVIVPDREVAIGNDTAIDDLGRLTLRNVRARGQVLLLADDAVRRGHVEVDGLAVASADLRGRPDRPHGFGVDAMQGGFTLWNRQPDPAVRVTASLKGISAGATESPIRGSGVFVAGHGDRAGGADGSPAERHRRQRPADRADRTPLGGRIAQHPRGRHRHPRCGGRHRHPEGPAGDHGGRRGLGRGPSQR
jgi:hypothetical protein